MENDLVFLFQGGGKNKELEEPDRKFIMIQT